MIKKIFFVFFKVGSAPNLGLKLTTLRSGHMFYPLSHSGAPDKCLRAVHRAVRIRLCQDRVYQWGIIMKMAQILISTLVKQAKLRVKD